MIAKGQRMQQVKPIPRRWWWRRWFLLPALVFAAVALGARLWWGHVAHQRLAAQIDAIRQRGEPLTLREMLPQPTPADEQTTRLYQEAVDLSPFADVRFKGPDGRRLRRLENMAFDPMLSHASFRQGHAAELKEILDLSAPALAKAHEAAGTGGRVLWPVDPDTAAFMMPLPPLGEYRPLAKIQRLSALAAHEAGDDAAALARVEDMLTLGDAFSRDKSWLITHLVRVSIDSLAAATVEEIAPTLRVGQPGGASPEQVRRLAERLLDDQELSHGLYLAFVGEQWFQYDILERLRDGRMSLSSINQMQGPPERTPAYQRPLLWLIEPMFALEEARVLEHMTGLVQSARQQNYPAAKSLQPAIVIQTHPIRQISRLLSQILTPTLTRVFDLNYQCLAERRMAALALAIRLYELDKGARPAQLDQLVPQYLSALPVDPYSAANKSFGYAPSAKPPLLYAVHTNGADDSGAFTAWGSGIIAGAVNYDASADLPFFLDGQRPRGPVQWVDPTAEEDGPPGPPPPGMPPFGEPIPAAPTTGSAPASRPVSG